MIVLKMYRTSENQSEAALEKTGSGAGEPETTEKPKTEVRPEAGAKPETGTERKAGNDEAERTEEDSEIKRVFICSPFHPQGNSEAEREKNLRKNVAIAQDICRFAIGEKCIPYAPHLFFPQILSEKDPNERELGLLFGLDWLSECDELWIIGLRISEGMKREIRQAIEWDIPIRWVLPDASPEEEALLSDIFGVDIFNEEMN